MSEWGQDNSSGWGDGGGGGGGGWGNESSGGGGGGWGTDSGGGASKGGGSGGWNSSGGAGGGSMGGSREKKPGDWDCPSCNQNNFASRRQCFKCKTPNPNAPAGGGGREKRPGDWDCPGCNQSNFASRQQCFKCQAIKPTGAQSNGSSGGRGASDGGGWGGPPASSSSTGGSSGWGSGGGSGGGDSGGWGSGGGASSSANTGGGSGWGEGGGDSGGWGSGGASASTGAGEGGGWSGGGGGREVRPGDWDCSGCNTSNFASKRQCRKCQAPNPNPPAGGREKRPGDWDCPSCSQSNFANRQQCFKCQEAKPANLESNNKRPSDSDGGSGGGGWGTEPSNDDPNRKRSRMDDSTAGEDRPEPYRPPELNLEEEAELQNNGAGENFFRYKEQTVTCLPPDAIKPIEKFEDLITSDLLLANVNSLKYAEMTPIQKWAMPAIVEGRDIIGCAQTGSGKTAAFLLPILQNLLKTDLDPSDPNGECQNPYCLIIAPTRELADQTYRNACMLAKDSIINCCVLYGQIPTSLLKTRLSKGCHVLVATPGRLKDFVNRGWIGFKNIKFVVLDEGDRLVDEGFNEDIRSFFSDPNMPSKDVRQTFFFSATFKPQTQLNAKEYLKDDFLFLTVGRVGAANEDIKQEFLQVPKVEKKRELKRILAELPESDKTIIFTQTKAAADMLAGFFSAQNLSATSIHGDRHQHQRAQAISDFRKGLKRFLISSPVGNRGLDLPKVAVVINYDLPVNVDEYVHRIGRTGRAGHTGRAISFYDADRDIEILPELLDILREAKQTIPDWMNPAAGVAAITGQGDAGAMDDDWGADDSAPPASEPQDNGMTAETPGDEAADRTAPAEAQVEVDEW